MTRNAALSPLVLFLTVAFATLLWSATSVRAAESTASLTINRLVICSGVDNHEPVDNVTTFPAGTERAYAFLEATNISSDVEVSFVWLYQGKEVARVILPIRAGNRWRTYSSKTLAGRSGAWRVEVQDAGGTNLAAVDFTVQ